MNIQRFTAPTAREALAKARMTFGDGTLILSNRPTASGVEVVATGEDTLEALDRDEQDRQNQRPPATKTAPTISVNPDSQVAEDTAQLAMSTLSFQDYVRERMLRRRHEAMAVKNTPPLTPERQEQPLAARTPAFAVRATSRQPEIAPIQVKRAAPRTPATLPSTAPSQGIVDELHAMKVLIEDRFNTLTWIGQARQNPIHSNLMLKLIRSGYSPTLSRTIMERMPESLNPGDAIRWVTDVLTRNLRTDSASIAIHEQGGTYALVGATGVGKTTTAAKLAGLCARTHGPASVGLITLDTYRVGAHEQLRSYGDRKSVV